MSEKTKCTHCKKQIDWDEYVINWGWCNLCFDNDYAIYLAEQEQRERTEHSEG